MPSSPLPSTHAPVDLAHLKRMTSGEAELEREVLQLFLSQTRRLVDALDQRSADVAALAHTLLGSARAIGAFRLAESATALEQAIRHGRDGASELVALRAAAADARGAVEALLRRP
jgi:HPt (histidine-containing phosphotransfer) domain-containing protein